MVAMLHMLINLYLLIFSSSVIICTSTQLVSNLVFNDVNISVTGFVVRAEDEVEVDDDTVDIEPDAGDDAGETAVTEDEDAVPTLTKSPDGESTILFLKPKPGLIGISGSPGEFQLFT